MSELEEKEAAEEQAEKEFLAAKAEEDFRQCHFCGEYVKDGKESDGKRHWLSDCRPDLIEHEIGDTCTWAYMRKEENFREENACYAYQNHETNEWTDKHEHFYTDGPM
jgi:hypothetical protein